MSYNNNNVHTNTNEFREKIQNIKFESKTNKTCKGQEMEIIYLPELYCVYCWYCGWKLWIASVIMSFGFIVSYRKCIKS